nr:uncharacterized protein LOC107976330 [Pan troglodytes]
MRCQASRHVRTGFQMPRPSSRSLMNVTSQEKYASTLKSKAFQPVQWWESPPALPAQSFPIEEECENDAQAREAYYKTASYLSFPGANMNEDPERGEGKEKLPKTDNGRKEVSTKSILG